MGVGVVLTTLNGQPVAEISEAAGPGTSNIAEYIAVIRALEKAKELKFDKVTILTDSQLVHRQITAEYQANTNHTKHLLWAVYAVGTGIEWECLHIPRAQNVRANYLARQAIKGGDTESRSAEIARSILKTKSRKEGTK
jgi:ribonuclease HI